MEGASFISKSSIISLRCLGGWKGVLGFGSHLELLGERHQTSHIQKNLSQLRLQVSPTALILLQILFELVNCGFAFQALVLQFVSQVILHALIIRILEQAISLGEIEQIVPMLRASLGLLLQLDLLLSFPLPPSFTTPTRLCTHIRKPCPSPQQATPTCSSSSCLMIKLSSPLLTSSLTAADWSVVSAFSVTSSCKFSLPPSSSSGEGILAPAESGVSASLNFFFAGFPRLFSFNKFREVGGPVGVAFLATSASN